MVISVTNHEVQLFLCISDTNILFSGLYFALFVYLQGILIWNFERRLNKEVNIIS